MTKRFHRVAVLYGGWGSEREVSLVSGQEVATALQQAGYDTHLIDCDKTLPQRLSELKPDVCFNALHGRMGEDGCVQGLLNVMNIPYTHSGVTASACAMDKRHTKTILRHEGLPVLDDWHYNTNALPADLPLPVPAVVKPVHGGSSVGIYLLQESQDYQPCQIASNLGQNVPIMFEPYYQGRELTVAVLEGHPLAITEIIYSKAGWYDYQEKYAEDGALHILPAKLPQSLSTQILEAAKKAHDYLGCNGLTRVDFLCNPANQEMPFIILEINTQPGMTPRSLAPEQAAYCGIDFLSFVTKLIEAAQCGH